VRIRHGWKQAIIPREVAAQAARLYDDARNSCGDSGILEYHHASELAGVSMQRWNKSIVK